MRKKLMAAAAMICLLISALMSLAARYDAGKLRLSTNYLSMYIGEVYNFSVSLNHGSETKADLVWSSNSSGAIRRDGTTVYANAVGTATVWVRTSDGEYIDSCQITVLPGVATNPVYPYPYTGAYYYYWPVYTISAAPTPTPSVQTTVVSGAADSAQQLAIELEQSARTSLDGQDVDFSFTRANKKLLIEPLRTEADKLNAVSFNGNILSRLKQFDYEYVEYRIPGISARLYPELNDSVSNSLSIQRAIPSSSAWASYRSRCVSGPWQIGTNGDAAGLSLCLTLKQAYEEDDLTLLMWDGSSFAAVSGGRWKLSNDGSGTDAEYYLTTGKLEAGTYAVIES